VPSTLRASGWRPKNAARHRSSAPNGGWSSYIRISSRMTSFSVLKSSTRSAGRIIRASSAVASSCWGGRTAAW
jgi:hypothetical protein